MKNLIKRLNIFNKITGKNQIAIRKENEEDVKIAGGKKLKKGDYDVNKEF